MELLILRPLLKMTENVNPATFTSKLIQPTVLLQSSIYRFDGHEKLTQNDFKSQVFVINMPNQEKKSA